MSFSADLKNELCSVNTTLCCLKAETFGLLLFGRSFSLREISLLTELNCVAERYCNNIRMLTGVSPAVKRTEAGNYKIYIEKQCDRDKIIEYFGYSGKEIVLRVNLSNLENTEEECCFKAFIRGAFLSCGSISNPQKDYHIEFNIQKIKLCEDLKKIIDESGLKAKSIARPGGFMLYCKEAEGVEDYIGAMGATASFFYVMETRAVKTVKNQINRRTNFEAANLSRTIDTGLAQADLINDILSKIELTDMTEDLSELCRLRLDNPDITLENLGKMMTPPLSRSAVSRRFKKLEKIKEELEHR